MQHSCITDNIDHYLLQLKHNALHLKVKLMQYRNAVVGAEMEIWVFATYCYADVVEYEQSFKLILDSYNLCEKFEVTVHKFTDL